MIPDCVIEYVENDLGFPLKSFPESGVEVRVSEARSEPGNGLLIVRCGQSALATGVPRVVEVMGPVIETMDIWTLFSRYGVAELGRALASVDVEVKGGGFHHVITEDRFCRPEVVEEPVKLVDDPGVEKQYDKKFKDAFAVYRDDMPAAMAQIRWKRDDFIEIAVDTHEDFRQRGFGLAVVAKAAEWIFEQGAVVHYPVMPANIPSMRIIRRLGGIVAWQEIYG